MATPNPRIRRQRANPRIRCSKRVTCLNELWLGTKALALCKVCNRYANDLLWSAIRQEVKKNAR